MKMARWRGKAACPDRQEGVPRVWPFSGSTPSLPTGPSPHLGLAGRGSAGGPWGALGMNCRIPSPQQFLNANHRSTAPACTACPFRTVRGLMARCGPSTWLKRRQLRRGWVPACLAPLPGGGGFLDHPVLCSYPTRQHPVPLHPRPSSPASWTTTSTPVGRSGPRPSSSNVPSFVSATRAPSAPRCDSDGWCPAQKPWPTAAPFPASVSLGA